MRALSRFEKGCAALVAVGLALRLQIFAHRNVGFDGGWFMTMARSLLEMGEFRIPWVEGLPYTQHYPPAFPALIALAFQVFGRSLVVAEGVMLFVAVFLVAVAYWTTADLYGREKGLAVAALVACFPPLHRLDGLLLSESLVVAFFALTIWGIVKSLDRPPFILVAGIFAALGYLTKSSMGYFFILAGAAGLAWRFSYVRWRVFSDRWYMAAAGVFAGVVLLWAGRNVLRHGWPHWETQPYATYALGRLFSEAPWPGILVQEFLWSASLLLIFALPLLPGIVRSWRDIRHERTSALWLAIVTPSFVALFFVSAFYAIENFGSIFTHVNERYLVPALVPLLWLGIRDLDLAPDEPAGAPVAGGELVRKRALFASLGVGLIAVTLAVNPTIPYNSIVRVILLDALVLVGVLLVAVSFAYAWRPVEKVERDGRRAWRAVGDPSGAGKRVGAAALILAAGFTMGAFVALEYLPFFAAGAVALLLRDARAKVLAVVVILAGAPFAGVATEKRWDDVARDVSELEPRTVKVFAGLEARLWPLLDEGIVIVPVTADDADVLVDVRETGKGAGPAPPPGYEVVHEYETIYVFGPGTRVGLVVWGAFLGDQAPPPATMDGYVYAKVAR